MYGNNERGITLVESLAAAVILGIVIIAFVTVSNYSLLADTKSDRDIEVQRIAEEQLNLARDYALRHNGALPANPEIEGYSVTLQQTDFAPSATISYTTTAFGTNHFSLQGVILVNKAPKLLTVTVSWNEASS
ncbi:type IV pilus modification PilV family protein [Paenibacillus koleovorans]|uniref:type IV pilus modification PilV family protein n=1 Tax=Paenibacillus koleovorans TaxID=121608 RepID=UPI000FD8FEAA|nr:type II secretion system protein [Paenibacillus koleovorans]